MARSRIPTFTGLGLSLFLTTATVSPAAAGSLDSFVKRPVGEQVAYIRGMTDALVDMSGLRCPDSVTVSSLVVRVQHAAQSRELAGDLEAYLAIARVLLDDFKCTFPEKETASTVKPNA